MISGPVDLILENGDIRTQDPDNPRAQAVAVHNGRILAVGDRAHVREIAGSAVRTIDLEGRALLPGFMDSHFHYYQWAVNRANMQLDKVRSFEECMQTIAQAAAAAGPEDWLQGQGFNETDWPENRMPLRDDLDRVAPHHPVLIWRCDLHLAVANSKALKLSRLDDSAPAPHAGGPDRDQHGRINGVLREAAINLVKDAVPVPDEETLVQAMLSAQKELHSLGITGVHDVRLSGAVSEAALTLRCWQLMRERNLLQLRTWASLPGEARSQAQELGLRTGLGDDLLRIGHLKYFFDGGMGARTGWMLDPYLDTGEHGLCTYPPEELYYEMVRAHQAGLAVMIHAIGNRAVRELITLYERLYADPNAGAAPGPALSHRMEHCQVIAPEDIPRLVRLNIPVSMQPTNMVLDINMIDQCAGREVGKCSYAFRKILDAGILMMLSSDCPVCDPDPLVGIQGAVTRRRADGTPAEGWNPHLCISVDEALGAYTTAPARAYNQTDHAGSITPGKRADLIAMQRNPYEVDPLEIIQCRVALTVFDGRVVFES